MTVPVEVYILAMATCWMIGVATWQGILLAVDGHTMRLDETRRRALLVGIHVAAAIMGGIQLAWKWP